MLIKTTKASDPRPSEITSESVYKERRSFLRSMGFVGAGALLGSSACAQSNDAKPPLIKGVVKSPYSSSEDINSWEDVTQYNNFYEFGTAKEDPYENGGSFNPKPWSVTVDGECDAGGTFTLEDLLKPHTIEERIYRMRCVEAWSMVIPWNGFPLGDMLKRFKPNSNAKYVAFETIERPEEMPGQRRPILPWPYREGLRMDEAMHPLTIMSTGIFGHELPNQNGAPLRLVVPWKYGFKNIKSIVRISFTEEMPYTSWSDSAPWEYGFYANVNPEVDHPRWSQARERAIGGSLFAAKQPTLMFNGYEEEVAGLYSGMNLREWF